jgi:hypothetical protein
MPCPSTHTLTGRDWTRSDYHPNGGAAIAAASAQVPASARLQAGFAFNRFDCPERLCKRKTLGPVSHTITRTVSGLSLLDSFFWWQWQHYGKAYYDWTCTVTCSELLSDEWIDFVSRFTRDANASIGDHWLWFTGWFGNLVSSMGIARGCADWVDWVLSWINSNGWRERLLKVRHCHYWSWGFKHQVVCVTLPDGTELVLDPWRDPLNPVWEKSDYERQFSALTCEDTY